MQLIRTATTEELIDHILGEADFRGFLGPGGWVSGTPVTLKKVVLDVLGEADITWLLPADPEEEDRKAEESRAEALKSVVWSFADEIQAAAAEEPEPPEDAGLPGGICGANPEEPAQDEADDALPFPDPDEPVVAAVPEAQDLPVKKRDRESEESTGGG